MMNKLLCGQRILVVEHETLIRMVIEIMLADLGCESVTGAVTVAKALALFDAEVFDAAIPGMNMNGNTSRLTAEALIERGVPFIYCYGVVLLPVA